MTPGPPLRRVAAGLSLVAMTASCATTSTAPPTTAPADGRPVVQLSPPPPADGYRNGQSVTLSVKANHYFTRYLRIEILECSDPGGQAAHLPTSDQTCDGNTVPNQSVLVNEDGSFSTTGYQLFSLPNTALDESWDNLPVCDATHWCTLYVGLDQTDFSKPHVFSVPFLIRPTAGSTPRKSA